ncbi:hypothetical protein Tco_1126399, partial [Tanacetum coccineum]
ALSHQPRERTRGSIFIQDDSGPSESSSSKRPRVCNDSQSRNPSDLPNHHTPAVTTSGTPSDTSGGRLDFTSTVYFHRAFSYQPRKCTRGSIFIQKDSGTSGISSSKRPRVCNNGRSQKPSERIKDGFRSARPKYHHCCMAGGCPYDATQSFDTALAIKPQSFIVQLCELFTYAHTEMTSEGVKQGLDRPFSGFKHGGLRSLLNSLLVAAVAVSLVHLNLNTKIKYLSFPL